MKVLAVLVVLAATLLDLALGQTVAEQYLKPHNDARAAFGAPALQWSTKLQTYATNWANNRSTKANCALSHSKGAYGENIYWSSGSSTPQDAVKAWVAEKQWYNVASNTCQTNKVCGHYTQVIWRNTKFVGCGSANCPGGGKFVVCSYDPPGNVIGQRP